MALGYQCSWRPRDLNSDEWDGSGPRPLFWEWRATAGGAALDALAVDEVTRLGLCNLTGSPGRTAYPILDPWGRYWRACLLSDYERDRLSDILDWGRDGLLTRAYPPSQMLAAIIVTTRPPRIRIEGPLELATRHNLEDAVNRVLELVGRQRPPLTEARRVKAGAIVRRRDDPRKQLTRRMHADGRTSSEIADEIALRFPDDVVDASTVRRWIRSSPR